MSSLHYDAIVSERDVAVRLEIAAGETLALIGPNGAGKSTVLNVIAGLIAPDSGGVSLDGRPLAGLPPYKRSVALLAQDPLLFPHMTALDNVAFGPRSAGAGKSDSRRIGQQLLEQVGVGELVGRKPHQLSGGQAQRVAVARALAAQPQLLLLDEPMAALDVAVTPALRQTLRTVLADRTALIVTHDALDALLLADRVVVIDNGRVVEEGPTRVVLSQPRSAFAARIAGLNLVAGRWDGHAVVSPSAVVTGMPAEPTPRLEKESIAVFSPSAVSVYADAPHGSPRNTLLAVITSIEPLGDRVRIRTNLGDLQIAAEVTPAAAAELDLTPGTDVYLSIKATEVTAYGA